MQINNTHINRINTSFVFFVEMFGKISVACFEFYLVDFIVIGEIVCCFKSYMTTTAVLRNEVIHVEF